MTQENYNKLVLMMADKGVRQEAFDLLADLKAEKDAINIDTEKLIGDLSTCLTMIKDERSEMLIKDFQQALDELHQGNQVDGDWQRVRRAIFLMENGIKWYQRKTIKTL